MARWRDRMLVVVATGLGLGRTPGAPGTAGALLGVAIFVLIDRAAPAAAQTWLLVLALLVVCVVTVALGPWAERHWGRKDPGAFVLDEVAGFLLTVILFRRGSLWLTVIWAFAVTRLLDIVKPPPARQLERLPGGWGVLADDLCASLYAAGVLHIAALCLPRLFGAGSLGGAP